jgi:hypothetical protein
VKTKYLPIVFMVGLLVFFAMALTVSWWILSQVRG